MYQKNSERYKNIAKFVKNFWKKKKSVLYEPSLRIINFKFEIYMSLAQSRAIEMNDSSIIAEDSKEVLGEDRAEIVRDS